MPELRRREATLRAELDALDTELHDAETYLKLTETLDAFRARLVSQRRDAHDRAAPRDRPPRRPRGPARRRRHHRPSLNPASQRTVSQAVRYCIHSVKALRKAVR